MLVGVFGAALPAYLKVQPVSHFEVDLLIQTIAELIEEEMGAVGLALDDEVAVVNVLVTGGAEADEVLGLGFTAFRERFQMMDVEPNSVGAPRSGAAPAVAA